MMNRRQFALLGSAGLLSRYLTAYTGRPSSLIHKNQERHSPLTAYGPTRATTGANAIIYPSGDLAWANPGAVTGTSGYANITMRLRGLSQALQCGGFNFNIPANAGISGVEVTANILNTMEPNPPFGYLYVELWNSVTGYISNQSFNKTASETSTVIPMTFGGPQDRWDANITPSQVNGSDFYVLFLAYCGNYNNHGQAEINDVVVTIYTG